ncbi:MAG: type II toxin-antitoxin system RelE/ParE family toxin [Desulfobacteraceae bacterium]|nr:type II toxin-antitoxin system RelE/ParE family toxin [Desulfobacteraceae bacterium]
MTEMTSSSQWQVIITPNVKKRLAKLRRPERERILQALVDLKKDPFHQDVKSLKGRPEWRLRVGQWRVILRVDSDNLVIVALALGARGDVYKR